MSDEEIMSDGSIKRRKPSWQLTQFNQFLILLDSCADLILKTARKQRVEGSPLKVAPPSSCPQ